VILGPDGPSLGGFVSPITIVHAELWKMGQLRPGDTVRFRFMSLEQANHLEQLQDATIAALKLPQQQDAYPAAQKMGSPIVHTIPAKGEQVQVVYRQSGDRNLLIEYGPLVLDLNLRFRVHALMEWVQGAVADGSLPGILDLTPGIRSLQIHFDSRVLAREALVKMLVKAEKKLTTLLPPGRWTRASDTLILHGRRDPDVPAASAEALHAALLPHYAGCADRLRLKVYPALGHTISRPESAEVAAAQQELCEDVNAWFGRFL